MTDPGDSKCPTCMREHADESAALIEAFHAAGAARLLHAVRELPRDDELIEAIRRALKPRVVISQNGGINTAIIRVVIEAVRAHDEKTLAMRDAADDHQAQNNQDMEANGEHPY